MSDREQCILRQAVKFDSMVINELGMSANEALKAFSEGRLKSNNIEQQLQQAHRQGWEQCQREARDKAEAFAHAGKLCCMEKADKIKDAIASMEYKGADDGK